jgi:hypothetical protein
MYIRFKIDNQEDRQNMIIGFARAGIKVWEERKRKDIGESHSIYEYDDYICVEQDNEELKKLLES